METQKQRELRKEFSGIVEQVFDTLGEEFRFERNNSINLNQSRLKKFHIYASRNGAELVDVWMISKDKKIFHLCTVAFETTITLRGQYSHFSETQEHLYFYGYLKPSRDFGNSLIRPETTGDKIAELFSKKEIDFLEQKRFSSKYYCISAEKETFERSMNIELMDYLASLNYIELEFNHDGCLFRLEHSIANREEALKFFYTGSKLAELI